MSELKNRDEKPGDMNEYLCVSKCGTEFFAWNGVFGTWFQKTLQDDNTFKDVEIPTSLDFYWSTNRLEHLKYPKILGVTGLNNELSGQSIEYQLNVYKSSFNQLASDSEVKSRYNIIANNMDYKVVKDGLQFMKK